ncbi:hypothetical protein NKR23_g7989 [Pleurostoma richardsiae]|uniref:Uncharacterized protein n=1 Tax=Pleurostoma richardsiae TaxID=41990 RepID=A0AA38RAS6_9PEZI|nr:hypothetical protein NKR23_g7989 [Pleurostoma richardsiae]
MAAQVSDALRTSTSRGLVLASHGDGAPTIRFTDPTQLFQAIDHISGDFVIVTDVSSDDFARIELERERERRAFRFRRYHADAHILVVTIPTKLHEELHIQLNRTYDHKLVRMGLEHSWIMMGSATFRAQNHPRGDGGEGDSVGGPNPERATINGWPTLVIEAGDSESLNALHQDMEWWFAASNHEVKIVLLAKFDHIRHEIILERWEERSPNPRSGATTTPHAAVLRPRLQQEIVITRDATTNPPSYNVISDALVLSFELLFGRPPRGHEEDFEFSIAELKRYAEYVWAFVRD